MNPEFQARPIDIEKVLASAGRIYAKAKAEKGERVATVIPSDQVKAMARAIVNAVNESHYGYLQLVDPRKKTLELMDLERKERNKKA